MLGSTVSLDRGDSRSWWLAAASLYAVAGAVVAISGPPSGEPNDLTGVAVAYFCLMYTAVGVIVLQRRPEHGLGRLTLVLGLGIATSILLDRLVITLSRADDLLALVTDTIANMAMLMGLVVLIVWFPDGRRTSRLGGVVEGLLLVGFGALFVAADRGLVATIGWPALDEAVLGSLESAGYLTVATALVGAIVDLGIRYRRGDAVMRAQTRWVMAAAAVNVLTLLGVMVLGSQFDVLFFVWFLSLGLPILAVAVAITRYHLYDIDQIVSRSISYAVVTMLLFATFAGVALLMQSAIGGAVAGPGSALDPAVVAASTLVVAALFNPVRTRVQRTVDRRFHRTRYDAERIVGGFAGRLRGNLDLPTLTGELRRTTVEAIEPSATAVWLRSRP